MPALRAAVGAAVGAGMVAALLGACAPHPATAQDFKDAAAKPVDTSQSIAQALDLTLVEVARGRMLDNTAEVALSDSAEDLQKELKIVQGYDARGAADVKAKVVEAIQGAVGVAEQVRDGADKGKARDIEPRAKDAAQAFDGVAKLLPDPDKP